MVAGGTVHPSSSSSLSRRHRHAWHQTHENLSLQLSLLLNFLHSVGLSAVSFHSYSTLELHFTPSDPAILRGSDTTFCYYIYGGRGVVAWIVDVYIS